MSRKKQTSFELLGTVVEAGKREVLTLEVAKLHTRNSIHLPVIVEHSGKPGPVLLLMAGVHGDEVNGIGIVHRMVRKAIKPEIGTVIFIPVLNVFGYLNQRREFPDGRDLNRVFPGTSSGSLASQFAHRFSTDIAPKVDIVLDFHTGAADRDNFPQVRCDFRDNDALELSQVFNPPFIVHSKQIPKSVRQFFSKLGKTMILFEGGKSGALDERVIEQGVQGCNRVLQHLGIKSIIPPVADERNQGAPMVMIEKSRWLRAPHSGMWHPQVLNGTMLNQGQVLGYITDTYGEFERKVKCPQDGFLFCMNTAPVVHKGDALFHIGR